MSNASESKYLVEADAPELHLSPKELLASQQHKYLSVNLIARRAREQADAAWGILKAAPAFARTRIPAQGGAGRGFRVLRASLATRMLEGDTALPVISGALGHRGIDSAKHYLAADEERTRACCLDFTGIEAAAMS